MVSVRYCMWLLHVGHMTDVGGDSISNIIAGFLVTGLHDMDEFIQGQLLLAVSSSSWCT